MASPRSPSRCVIRFMVPMFAPLVIEMMQLASKLQAIYFQYIAKSIEIQRQKKPGILGGEPG